MDQYAELGMNLPSQEFQKKAAEQDKDVRRQDRLYLNQIEKEK